MRTLATVLAVALVAGCASSNKDFAKEWAEKNTVTVEHEGKTITATGGQAGTLLESLFNAACPKEPQAPDAKAAKESQIAYQNAMVVHYVANIGCVLAKALGGKTDPNGIAIAAMNADARENLAWIQGGTSLGGTIATLGSQWLINKDNQKTQQTLIRELANGGDIFIGSISQSQNGITASGGEGAGGTVNADGDRTINIGRNSMINASEEAIVTQDAVLEQSLITNQRESTDPVNNLDTNKPNNFNGESNLDNNGTQGNTCGDNSTGCTGDANIQPDDEDIGIF